MSFTWNDNIPGPNDPFSQSQGQLQTNLNTLNSVFNIDHVPYTPVNATQGQHKQITYNAPLTPSAPAGSVGLEYTKTVSTSGSSGSELHYRNITKESQITFSGLSASSGQGGVPGGLQIRSGQGSTGTPILFSPSFPTDFKAIVATAFANGEQINIISPTPSGFTGARGGGGGAVNFFWIATGY